MAPAALAILAPAAPATAAAPGTPRLCARWLELADEAERAGDPATARSHLALALERDPECSEAHARLASATGPATALAAADLDAALRIAVAHPYDPRALLAAGRRAAESGRRELATPLLEKVLWLGDLDPGSTAAAHELLAALDPAAPRRAVPVHAFADAALREDPGWRFRIRTRWADASRLLAPVLGARFALLQVEPFEAGAPADVETGMVALAKVDAPEYGIVAGMLAALGPEATARDPRRGAAEFLGRRLVVRLEPGAPGERLLAHEILHLYGAVHAAAGVDSLMNAMGDSKQVDAANRRILAQTSARVFGPGGVERNLLPELELADAIDAWGAALQLDLARRGPELARALAASALSPGAAGPDPHMGDVAHWVGALLVAAGRADEGALLLETASALHGSETPSGRAEARRARELREGAD